MVTLILTEKPSVAMDFAKALGARKRGDGFIEGEGYCITWAVGHLVELAEPGDYHPQWEKWSLHTLPILPDSLKYKPIARAKKQLEVVQNQLRRSDLDKVVIATDAGREGEVIARTILQTVDHHAGEVYRFWTSQALTPQVVRETMQSLKPAAELDRLWNAGRVRQAADWLVGMNLSRAATLKLGGFEDTFSVGRVQTAVLSLLVDRRREREHFKPEPYWLLRVHFANARGLWWGTWFKKKQNRFDLQEEAERILNLVQGQTGQVGSVKRETKKQPPPMLYALTDLQREANARFGLSAKQTIDIAQKLYEDRKCLSYPRTDAKVLGSKSVELAKGIIAKLSAVYPELFEGIMPKRLTLSNKRVFNDAKLTDHHALIPLAPLLPKAGREEKQVYELVLKRFAAVFHADYEYEATEIITDVCKETFRTTGNRPLVLGWKAVYGLAEPTGGGGESQDEPEEQNLPLLEKDDPAQVEEARIEEKMTQPPPEYTEALLLRDMTNPSRYVDEAELQKIFKGDIGLGTQATRAQIIETLLNRRYVVREKKKLMATDKGCFLIDRLRRFDEVKAITTPEETARWELELEKIAQGVGSPDVFMEGIRQFIIKGVEELAMNQEQSNAGQSLGVCPACGGEIIEGKKGYGCSRWREQDGGCRFVVWKEIAGQAIDPEVLKVLLSGEVSPVLTFRSKEGKSFSASLKLDHDEQSGKWSTRFVFGNEEPGSGKNGAAEKSSEPGAALGKCPACGGAVVEGKKGYGCDRWREQDGGCRFVVWKVIAGKEIPREAVRDLLEKGETELIHGFVSRAGKTFSAKLRLEGETFKTSFVFV